MKPLISVIIPIYGVEKYLNRCVESVIGQSYSNLEIILVDDESPDNCPTMCDSYQSKDVRIKVIHKKNGGLSDARNAGIEIATGEYLTFIDSDDWVSENYVEALYRQIVECQADIAIIDTVESDGTVQSEKSYNVSGIKEKTYTPEEALGVILRQEEFNTSAWGKLYKREFFTKARFTYGIIYEDLDLIYQIIDSAQKISFSNEAKYYYFQRPGSIAHETFHEKHWILLEISQRMLTFVDNKYPNLHDAAVSRYVFSNFLILSKLIMDKQYLDKQQTIRSNILRIRKEALKNPYIVTKQKIKIILLCCGIDVYRFAFAKTNKE